MNQVSSARSFKTDHLRIYFASLTDDDIQRLVAACEEELELRSKEVRNEP
jgi:hypothetical protein